MPKGHHRHPGRQPAGKAGTLRCLFWILVELQEDLPMPKSGGDPMSVIREQTEGAREGAIGNLDGGGYGDGY